MANSLASKNVGLLRLVEERSLTKKIEEEKKHKREKQVPYLHKDCISNILVRLPLDSLQRSRFVCKPWYNIIKNPKFIDAHLHRSESVLIFLSPFPNESLYPFSVASVPKELPNTVSVELNLLQPKPIPIFNHTTINAPRFSVQFLEFKNDKSKIGEYSLSCSGNIRATCNGLILLDNKLKNGGLVVMNPVTRKLIALPLGTLSRPHDESYGFALIDSTGEYKVVHLFRDELRFVDGPISAIGGLHWIPQVDRSEYIVSIEVDKEKFHQIPLPRSSRTHDRIVDMGGVLCLIVHEDVNHIDIWILKGFYGEVWTKYHSITVGSIIDMVPLFSLRIKGDIIFKRDEDGSFYVYDFQHQEMRKVEMVEGCIPRSSTTYLPHVNSLVSWMEVNLDMCD
ncbi:hypothetical protein PRUPE_1G556700 [Prunus persica]|uniref:F-box domain-containing protein n=1 Tax=Prunus persica TaxID=3760 RepID=A0A251RIQ5_PRUPE|nr:hypothetical protein PRUPE_1G556700 [Prunus persica]ONI35836.1 hypothetical protein PRUPE_1G556700 [Prunus persica]